ncbi:Uu.00g086250.m01.CDS01 [Anthostomella pinea]|uniref:Uu.00g086250.m01.CDS01 n=1 Tax=Anthostomella pinea TaxID=933095 RepID=A0AAI8YHG8_9PEZI|nr:Uu.00g086250.m01.CDS01 [Anthostomella pinea]
MLHLGFCSQESTHEIRQHARPEPSSNEVAQMRPRYPSPLATVQIATHAVIANLCLIALATLSYVEAKRKGGSDLTTAYVAAIWSLPFSLFEAIALSDRRDRRSRIGRPYTGTLVALHAVSMALLIGGATAITHSGSGNISRHYGETSEGEYALIDSGQPDAGEGLKVLLDLCWIVQALAR